jgi:hypothetical protein
MEIVEYVNEAGDDLLVSLEQDELLQELGIWPCREGRPFTSRSVSPADGLWPDLPTEGLLSLLGVS